MPAPKLARKMKRLALVPPAEKKNLRPRDMLHASDFPIHPFDEMHGGHQR